MLLVIGIDGANPELIERLTSTGQMPVLRSLMRHGVYGRLEPAPNCGPICAWSSLLTGVNPGKHGVWDLRNLVPESYEWQPAHARLLRAPTLAQILTDRGKEVGTLFVPMTYPAREAEWTTIAGWLAPSVDAPGFAQPRRAASMAARRLQGVPLAVQLGGYAAAGRYEPGLELALQALQAKVGLAQEMLADRSWDMLMVSITELDRVLRWYWHVHDRHHPDHREDTRSAGPDPVVRMHAEVDAAVGRLIEGLRPSDHLLVLSPYGVGVNSRAAACVPELMSHLDLLITRSAAGGLWHGFTRAVAGATDATFGLLRRLLPGRLADLVPVAADEGGATRIAEVDPWLDYERTWVIPAPGGHLFLNTESEFPLGVAGDGVIDQLVFRIASALQTAIDPATGRRPLLWVRSRHQVAGGPFLHRIPHLVTRWDATRTVEGLTVTGRDGRVHIARPTGGRAPSGAPCAEGMLIAAGLGLRRGARIEGAGVEDVAASIVHLCGEPVPSYFDGRVLAEAMTPGFLHRRPPRALERELPRIIEQPERIAETSRIVREHLRALGYEY
ncbi:MAG: alkaline phosphatase family protein [Armatimonadota bacterium]